MPGDTVDAGTGLLESEQVVMAGLIAAVEGFVALPVQHPDELGVFVAAIHTCQDLLAMRVVRRIYPEGWRNLEEKRRCV